MLPATRPANASYYYDTNGDRYCTPMDALWVINYLEHRLADRRGVRRSPRVRSHTCRHLGHQLRHSERKPGIRCRTAYSRRRLFRRGLKQRQRIRQPHPCTRVVGLRWLGNGPGEGSRRHRSPLLGVTWSAADSCFDFARVARSAADSRRQLAASHHGGSPWELRGGRSQWKRCSPLTTAWNGGGAALLVIPSRSRPCHTRKTPS